MCYIHTMGILFSRIKNRNPAQTTICTNLEVITESEARHKKTVYDFRQRTTKKFKKGKGIRESTCQVFNDEF